jgi:hypothetical protein
VPQKGENGLTGWDVSTFLKKKETVHGSRKHKVCYVTIRRRAVVLSKLNISIIFSLALQQLTVSRSMGKNVI